MALFGGIPAHGVFAHLAGALTRRAGLSLSPALGLERRPSRQKNCVLRYGAGGWAATACLAPRCNLLGGWAELCNVSIYTQRGDSSLSDAFPWVLFACSTPFCRSVGSHTSVSAGPSESSRLGIGVARGPTREYGAAVMTSHQKLRVNLHLKFERRQYEKISAIPKLPAKRLRQLNRL